jgi:hypothetical protein
MIDIGISAIEGAARRAREVTVVVFDEAIREVITTKNPGEILRRLKFGMGKHAFTDARPLFGIIKTMNPTIAVIFTDGFVSLPPTPPADTEVLWALMPETSTSMPFGTAYIMEMAW